jgi:hypothetical protein
MRVAPEIFRFGIRQKMVLVLLCVLTVALGTTSWLTIRQQEDNVLRETKQHGEDIARIVSQALAYSIVGYDYHTVQLLLDEIARSHDIGYAKVVTSWPSPVGRRSPGRTGRCSRRTWCSIREPWVWS